MSMTPEKFKQLILELFRNSFLVVKFQQNQGDSHEE